MPYQIVPDNLQDKMERCVGDVTKKGTPKPAAIAICYNSVVKGKELNYRLVVTPTTKAITDAPELRGEDARNCWNCQYFKSLPQTHLAEEVTDISAEINAPSDVVKASSGRGVCEQFEFETDSEWVCDAWAKIEPAMIGEKEFDESQHPRDEGGKFAGGAGGGVKTPRKKREIGGVSAGKTVTYANGSKQKVTMRHVDTLKGMNQQDDFDENSQLEPYHIDSGISAQWDRVDSNTGKPGAGYQNYGLSNVIKGKGGEFFAYKGLGSARTIFKVTNVVPNLRDDGSVMGGDGNWKKISTKEFPDSQNSLAVFKQADGNYRWVAISSNAFQDREKEIVTLKALADDCERADAQFKEHGDAARAYGTLRWWHVGKWDVANQIAGQGLDLGVCDFNAMHGKMLVESGTFHDPAIGAAIKEIAPQLELSIGFFHPLDQPDASGAYTQIRRFERSLLPRGRGSNPMTAFSVAYEKGDAMATLKEKLDEFVKMFGGTPQAKELANGVMQLAEQKENAAETAGVKSKEDATPVDAATKTPAEDNPSWFVADMKPEEFQALIARGVADALAPMLKELKEAQGVALKESGDALTTKLDGMIATQAAIDARLKELEGEQPRAFRASQEATTITADAKLKERAPGNDPKANEFMGWIAQNIASGMPSK